MSGNSFWSRWRRVVIICLLTSIPISHAAAGVIGKAEIRLERLSVDIDTRQDVNGLQSSMTTVKNFPAAMLAFVGLRETGATREMPSGYLVTMEITGPAFSEPVTLSGVPNHWVEIPVLRVAGEYIISGVRLEDAEGAVILERAPELSTILITVIDELLVTQVTSRPLTLEEIKEKGIVVDEDNFTAVNFAVGMTIGSEKVTIDLPMLIPRSNSGIATVAPPSATYQFDATQSFSGGVSIPNLSLVGFSLKIPDEMQDKQLDIPPITGVIVIPGDIAFMNQFFSVILQATNAAPEGSGLNLEGAMAAISLPLGKDGIADSADDPLRLAETAAHGKEGSLRLIDEEGSDTIVPGGVHEAEFLVEGLLEGVHTVNFDITGELYVPSLGERISLKGKAAGTVRVANPTFSITLAHPDVVREGEDYSVFATVTNTSASPANAFRLRLNGRSLSGATLAEGEREERELESLSPGDAETFEFHLVARTTGEVTGTVFLADPGVKGGYILTTGVGDTGIPLSPDTLILPGTVDYLPDDPDLVTGSVRLLGQAYSVATAPAGALPSNISRMSKGFVFDRAVKLAQAGLHVRFGETNEQVMRDILMDYLGNDMGRLDILYGEGASRRSLAEQDMRAFDYLRRASDAGLDFMATAGELFRKESAASSIAAFQYQWAESFASMPGHISFGVKCPNVEAFVSVTDGDGNVLGRKKNEPTLRREIPFSDEFHPLSDADFLLVTAPESSFYRFEVGFSGDVSSGLEIALTVPVGAQMKQFAFTVSGETLPAAAVCRLSRSLDDVGVPYLEIDNDDDGIVDRTIFPTVSDIEDSAPELLGVMQWAKGNAPATEVTFSTGDPLGRMVGLLFSEEVTAASATDISHYSVVDHHISQVALQPDGRMVFLMLEEPVGPFTKRELSVSGPTDMAGHSIEASGREILGDTERGLAGIVSGRVVGPDGAPIPFAELTYIQPLFYSTMMEEGCEDHVISEIHADASGKFQIDFVLRNDRVADNADRWLNELHAGGTNHFKLEAVDPLTGHMGRASARIQYDGQHMVLNVIIKGYGNLRGTVYDHENAPVTGGSGENYMVVAQNVSTGERFSARINENGQYAFPGTLLAPNDPAYASPMVTVGNLILRVLIPGDNPETGVITTNLPAAGVTVVQDILLQASTEFGTVSGRVLENDGTGAANVLVEISGRVLTSFGLYGQSYGSGVVGSTYTDENGFFEFGDVPAGNIEARAFRRETYESATAKGILEAGGNSALTLILPGSGETTIEGTVTDALGTPVEGAEVVAGPNLVYTDSSGHFVMEGLPLGTFTVSAKGPDGAMGVQTVQVRGSDNQTISISLQPLGSVAGVVKHADGEVLAGQKVQLWFEERGVMAETYTNGEGRYEFLRYPTGSYSVRAVDRDYGDGGMTYVSITAPNITVTADICFRGLGEIKGRVKVDGTGVIADVVITRKVWRIIPDGGGATDNYYLDYVDALKSQADEKTAAMIQETLDDTGATSPPSEYFMLVDEPVLISSDVLGPNGEVTGEYHFTGPVTAGPFRVTASNGFLVPAEKAGVILSACHPDYLNGVGEADITLESATASIRGTVFMPDGKTPAGANVRVTIQSLDSSGNIQLPEAYGGSTSQSALPTYSVTTNEEGFFSFPLVLRGRFILTSNTVSPANPASDPETIVTNDFDTLNVMLRGRTTGIAPSGETLVADIRLNGAGGVRVHVFGKDGETRIQGARVALSTASTLDQTEESSWNGYTDAQGEIVFLPVIEGSFSVSAEKDGVVGRAGGVIPEYPLNGYVQEVTIIMGSVVTDTGQTIEVAAFGEVSGTIFAADGTPLENPAQVTITSPGITLVSTSDENGHYALDRVPKGSFVVKVYEPFTARRGEGSGFIANDGDSVQMDVTLVGLGTVTGQVLSADGGATVGGADVVLYASGDFTDPLISRSDADNGGFWFPGVPLGEYRIRATDYETELTGTATGEMLRDGDANTTDVYLQKSGSIRGTVYDAGVLLSPEGDPVDENGLPLSPQLSVGASIVIRGGSFLRELTTGDDGKFGPTGNIPLGTYTVTVRAPGLRQQGASTKVVIDREGQIVDIPLVLSGLGTVVVTVKDSGCDDMVDGAEVLLRSGSYAGSTWNGISQAGIVTFGDVPEGNFSLSVSKTEIGITLGSTASGEIESHGQQVETTVCLQPSGGIEARILLPGGAVAAGAVLSITGGGVALTVMANEAGEVSVRGLPLGNYDIEVSHSDGGLAHRMASISINGQTISLGDIVLDNEAPKVVSTDPSAGASDVKSTSLSYIAIRFSEAIDPASVSTGTITASAGGSPVGGTVMVMEDPSLVRFTPSSPLPDTKAITVTLFGNQWGFNGEILSKGIRDLAGNGMASNIQFSFSTGDATPPIMASISPRSDAVEVALTSPIRMEFSEPIQRIPLLAAFSLVSGGEPVTGAFNGQPVFGDQVFIFSPAALEANKTYTVTIPAEGVVDMAGNGMDNPVTMSFRTIDTLPPLIMSIALENTSLIRGKTILLTPTLDSTNDVKRVDFYVDGEVTGSVTSPPFAFPFYLSPAYGDPVTVMVVAEDEAGNRSAAFRLDIPLEENMAPSVTITDPANDTTVFQGKTVTIGVDASDDLGLSLVSFTAGDGTLAGETRALDGREHAELTFSLTIPPDYKAGGEVVIRVKATDLLGRVSPVAERRLTVGDDIDPVVTIGSPANGALVDPGSEMTVFVQASDAGRIQSLRLEVGAMPEQDRLFSPSVSMAAWNFTVRLPSDMPPSNAMRVKATATDDAGNTGTDEILLRVSDKLGPEVVSVLPAANAGDVSVALPVVLEFDEPVLPDTIETGFEVMRADEETKLSGIWTLSDGNKRLTWYPYPSAFGFARRYRVVVGASLTDAAGNPAQARYSEFLTTSFAFIQPLAEASLIGGQSIILKTNGIDMSGIVAVDYRNSGGLIGRGLAPAPFPFEWNIPEGEENVAYPLMAMAVLGGENMGPGADVTGTLSISAKDFPPGKAVDGNVDRDFSGGGVAVVVSENGSVGWWQAKLVGSVPNADFMPLISKLKIIPAKGCCVENYRMAVLAATDPFVESDFQSGVLPDVFGNGAKLLYRTLDGAVEQEDVSLSGDGLPMIFRYLRVVHVGDEFLGLAEVEITEAERSAEAPEISVSISPSGGE